MQQLLSGDMNLLRLAVAHRNFPKASNDEFILSAEVTNLHSFQEICLQSGLVWVVQWEELLISSNIFNIMFYTLDGYTHILD